jgi:hypothetical protein
MLSSVQKIGDIFSVRWELRGEVMWLENATPTWSVNHHKAQTFRYRWEAEKIVCELHRDGKIDDEDLAAITIPPTRGTLPP